MSNTVVILGRRISIRANAADRPGRTVAYRSLPAEATAGIEGRTRGVDPQKSEAVAKPLPVRGNDYPDVAPESRRIIDAGFVSNRLSAGGSLPGFPTSLDTGLAPVRIRRRTQAADRGAVQPGTGTGRTGGLGYSVTNGGAPAIPHVRIPRTPITVTAFRRTVDTSSSIPARGIGAPLR